MPNIKCTAKLAKRAGFRIQPPTSDTPDDWHANIFTFDHRFYVIFVHDRSRLTCLAGPVKKPDLKDLEALLIKSLSTVLEYEGFSTTAIDYAISKNSNMNITKTNDRSVLGTINDNIFHITFHASRGGGVDITGIQNLCAHVNHMPMNPIGWKYAIEEYRQSVVHQVA